MTVTWPTCGTSPAQARELVAGERASGLMATTTATTATTAHPMAAGDSGPQCSISNCFAAILRQVVRPRSRPCLVREVKSAALLANRRPCQVPAQPAPAPGTAASISPRVQGTGTAEKVP